MPDATSVIILPTNAVTLFLNKQAGATVSYSNIIALGAYSAVSADTYGQLQNLGPTNAEVVVIPTNSISIFFAKEQSMATYLSIAASWGTLYSSISGLTYATLDVVP